MSIGQRLPQMARRQVTVPPGTSVVALARDLGFTARVIGFKEQYLVPLEAGPFTVEIISEREAFERLPTRAQARLAGVLQAGVQPQHILVYHERRTLSPREQGSIRHQLAVANTWMEQEFPAQSLRFARKTAKALGNVLRIAARLSGRALIFAAPIVGRVLVWILTKIVPVLAWGLFRLAVALLPLVASLATLAIAAVGLMVTSSIALAAVVVGGLLFIDPVLIIVVDGAWIELDRWVE